jgi:tetratricopeptide (TPR) repeat protein
VESFTGLTRILDSIPGNSSFERGLVQVLRGKILLDMGLFQEAQSVLYEAEDLLEDSSCASCLAKNHNYLGELYYRTKGIDPSMDRHYLALEVFREEGNPEEMAKTMALIGARLEKKQEYEKAIAFQQEALELSQSPKLSLISVFISENLGSIYEDLEKYDSAGFYFEKALQTALSVQDSTHLPGIYNNLGDVLRKTGRYEEAKAYSELALQISQKQHNIYQQKSSWVDISKAFQLMGQSDSAYFSLEIARKLDEVIFSVETARQFSFHEAQYSLKEQKNQIDQLNQLSKVDAKIKGLMTGLLILAISLGVVIFNRQKLKIRAGNELLVQQNKLLAVKEKLILSEKENINLLEARMSLEVESQAKALAAQTTHLLEKNQILEEIRKKLKQILETDQKEQKKKIRNLIKQIDFNFTQDADWEDFKESFEKVHQDFFKSLSKKGVELTPAEIKLASLIRMNLNSKEMASTLGISMESLRISRYRLRKKLGLGKGENLQYYIHCI